VTLSYARAIERDLTLGEDASGEPDERVRGAKLLGKYLVEDGILLPSPVRSYRSGVGGKLHLNWESNYYESPGEYLSTSRDDPSTLGEATQLGC
jgi:hypothetical protein